MPIYNRNQVGSTGAMGFVATEGYNNIADLGRALYESQLNDMAIFEAVCAADVHELNCVREGTMLESEMRALTEGSVRDFFKAVKERLKKIWEKIKSIFRQATAKLSTWVVRNGKAFVALHRKSLMSMNFSKVKVPNYRKPKNGFANGQFVMTNLSIDQIDDFKRHLKGNVPSMTAIRDQIVGEKDGLGDYFKTTMDECFEEAGEVPATQLNIQAMMDNLSTGSKAIKDMKKAEKSNEKEIKKVMKFLDDTERECSEKDKDKDPATNELLTLARACVSATESVMITMSKAHIKIIRFSMGQDRRALGYLVGNGLKEDAILEEAAALDDVEALNGEMESPFEAEITPDVAEIIDAAD